MAGSVEVASRLITAEEFARMRIDGPCELVDGRVVRMSPAGQWHGFVSARVHEALSDFVRRERLGLVVSAETGYVVRRDPDSVRAPDVAFLSHATIARSKEARTTFIAVAPDLAVEVLSPDDAWDAVEKKVEQYLAGGSKAVWVASPLRRKVFVYEPGDSRRVLDEGATLDGGPALPGFRVAVAELFQDVPPEDPSAAGA